MILIHEKKQAAAKNTFRNQYQGDHFCFLIPHDTLVLYEYYFPPYPVPPSHIRLVLWVVGVALARPSHVGDGGHPVRVVVENEGAGGRALILGLAEDLELTEFGFSWGKSATVKLKEISYRNGLTHCLFCYV